MQVLTWNLYHGRAVPPAGHDLLEVYAAIIAGWEWDVALLQEVPPWWPPALGRAARASARMALTSRNLLLPVRRLLAERRPDVIRSNGGGANAILVRGEPIAEHRAVTLRRHPERRVCHAVRLNSGLWCANLHAQVHSEERAQADIALAARSTLGWAGGAPAVLGGDFNVRVPVATGFEHLAGNGVDHVLGRGVGPVTGRRTLERGRLSDHRPVRVTLGAHEARLSG
ncbi:MAG: endonuclease/exonuclease/phosphatase family protein [Solirubrobacterales bacterium]|nr:endonuclease/exonuclease/phosphatase family protein [Solirubrobacterales bacterium]